MYVRIECQNNKYYSYVFAYFKYDYMPMYVVYNPIDEKFDIVANFSKKSDGHRQVGIMNFNEKDFVKKEELELNMGKVYNCFGYEWMINNPDLIRDIEENKPVKNEYVKLAKEMNSTINPKAWNEVNTEEEAEEMMNSVGGFHDWYLVSIEASTNPYDCDTESKTKLRFTSQTAFDTLLEFKDAYIKYYFEWANRIYSSRVIIDGENKYWVDDEEADISDIENYNYIQGSKLRWKFVLKEENDW